ncbi:MAG TPA: RAMP superfamily CRISPR-associated protein, partial [Blastocatellia bacterium]
MARVKITIRAESPLSLGATKGYGGSLIETGHHINGGQLRGALGALKEFVSEAEREEIDQLLGSPERLGLNFPNCYLTDDAPSFPLPLTAMTCKIKPGVCGERGDRKARHGVADTLLMQLAYDQVARDEVTGHWRIPLPFQYKCPQCGHRTEGYAGVVEYRGPKNYAEVRQSLHRQTRVAINRARQTAEEGQLYSVQAIDEGSLFIGLMSIDEERDLLARKWLQRIARVGGRASRGFGRVKVTVEDSNIHDQLRYSVEEFNRKYSEFEADLREIADEPPAPERRLLFTINLRSDAILRDSDGMPTLRFDEAGLRESLAALLSAEERPALEAVKFEMLAQFALPRR